MVGGHRTVCPLASRHRPRPCERVIEPVGLVEIGQLAVAPRCLDGFQLPLCGHFDPPASLVLFDIETRAAAAGVSKFAVRRKMGLYVDSLKRHNHISSQTAGRSGHENTLTEQYAFRYRSTESYTLHSLLI